MANAFYDKVRSASVERFNKFGEHMPTFVIETIRGAVVIPTPWADQQQKEIAVQVIHKICTALNASRVVVVVEGWMVTGDDAAKPGVIPAEHPKRQEVLWISGQSNVAGEAESSGLYPIIRDSAGKASLGEWEPMGQGATIFDGLVGRGVLQ